MHTCVIQEERLGPNYDPAHIKEMANIPGATAGRIPLVHRPIHALSVAMGRDKYPYPHILESPDK